MKKYYGIIGIAIAILLPVISYIAFKPLAEIPRPRAPHKLYPTGKTKERKDRDGEILIDSLYHVIPDQVFVNHLGDTFHLDSLRGKMYVANFFFASCPGICPVMSGQMKRIQDAFIRDFPLKLVSISVDPDRDSLPALSAYAERNGAIADKWLFLRAPKPEVYKLAKDGFFVTAKDDPGEGEDGFVHSEKLVLVDKDGNIRGYYSGIDSAKVGQLMGDIVLLLREYENESRYQFKIKRKK